MTAGKRISAAALPMTALLLAAMLFFANRAAALTGMLAERVMLCLQTLIPSLFGCMVLANLLQMSGCGAWLGGRLRLPAKWLHLPQEAAGIFLISQIAGYPVGTLLLHRAAEEGRLSAADAARLSCVCFGGGPAFLVGFAGVGLFGSAPAGWVMMGACIFANLLLARLLRPDAQPDLTAAAPIPCRLTASLLTDAVSASMKGLMQICGMVLLFGLLFFSAEQLGLSGLAERAGMHIGISAQILRAFFAAAADVTQLSAVFHCGLPFHLLLPLTAGLLSFGGICAQCQCLAGSRGNLRLPRLLLCRLLAATLTALVTACFLPLIPLPDAAAAFSVHAALSESRSPIPALLIFCTGFPFLLKKD